MPLENAFAEIALILLAAALVGAVGTWLRQPLIVSFIAVGILAGPAGMSLVTKHELFFFIDLGARLDLSLLGATFGEAMIFSAFVLIGNPLIVLAIMGLMGYRKRTSFLAGLTVAQISEFSLILGALGVSVVMWDRRR